MEVSSFHGGVESSWHPSSWIDSFLKDRSSAACISHMEELVNRHVVGFSGQAIQTEWGNKNNRARMRHKAGVERIQ